MTKGNAIGAGLLLAVVAFVLAFGLAGAGHGWGAPGLFSLMLLVLNPIAFVRALGPIDAVSASRAADMILLVVAACTDGLLFADAYGPERAYFQAAVDTSWLWVAAWMVLVLGGTIGILGLPKIAEWRLLTDDRL